MIDPQLVEQQNNETYNVLTTEYEALGEKLTRANIDIEEITKKTQAFRVAVPTWGVGTGGTRFARFPNPGEPRNIFEKLEDCAVIHQLVTCTPVVSPHFPWDKVSDFSELRGFADNLQIGFDAVNSNTFQDQTTQTHSYKYGSLTHTDRATREQAIAHNIDCIEWGKTLGSSALTVWIADGSNFPGQQHFQRSLERYLERRNRLGIHNVRLL